MPVTSALTPAGEKVLLLQRLDALRQDVEEHGLLWWGEKYDSEIAELRYEVGHPSSYNQYYDTGTRTVTLRISYSVRPLEPPPPLPLTPREARLSKWRRHK